MQNINYIIEKLKHWRVKLKQKVILYYEWNQYDINVICSKRSWSKSIWSWSNKVTLYYLIFLNHRLIIMHISKENEAKGTTATKKWENTLLTSCYRTRSAIQSCTRRSRSSFSWSKETRRWIQWQNRWRWKEKRRRWRCIQK